MKSNQRSAHSSRASAASTSDSRRRDGAQPGKSKSTPSTGLSLPTDFLMPDSLKMSDGSEATSLDTWIASRRVFHARTLAKADRAPGHVLDSRASGADFSGRSFVYSTKYAPHGWCLRTCRPCSIRAIAATLRQSSASLPNALMWDADGCWMLNISESPRNVAAFSWSRVLDEVPVPSSWLTPDSWKAYLARLARSQSHGQRMLGHPILYKPTTRRGGSLWAVPFSLLKRTDGVRTLSGSERLAIQGFARDWMTRALRNLTPQEMRSALLAHVGSRKKSTKRKAGK